MKLILKNYFHNKRSAIKTLATGYLLGGGFLSIGVMMYIEYKKYGYYTDHKNWIRIYGNDALVSSIGVMAASSIIFIYTIYMTIVYLFFANRSDFKEHSANPEYLICVKCQKTIFGKSVSTLACPSCGSPLEDTNGFYERHPELK